MNKYNGNGKPFVYVWFPPEEKDRAMAILEKFVEKNGNISFWWADKPLKKPDNIIRAAFSVIAFVKQSSLSDKHFRKVIDTAVRNEKKILPVHLEEMEYKTPWSRLALGSKQGIIRAAYKSDDQLIEKMTGAETFVNMKVTAGQKKNRRRQLERILGGLTAVALSVTAGLFLTGVIGFDPGDSEQTVEIGDFSISGTQAELDKITTLCIYGDREPTTDYVYNYIGFRDTNDNYSTYYLDPKQITEDTYFAGDLGIIRRGKMTDLSGLQYLRNLQTLVLEGQRISDISPIFKLKKLRFLSMRCNFIQTLDGIEAMENLEVVNFSYNKLTDVSSLFKCPKIREICLAFNFELSDLGCDYAPNVADLDIPFTKVEKAPVIGVGAENVWFVSNNTRVTDFSCLRAVKSFDWLAVGGSVKSNLLSNIKGKEIHKLGWEGADIESMQELADSGIVFTGQGYLNINHSNLKSLEGIENIKGNIKWLNLFETKQLTDMSPIQNLPNLISLGYDSRFESGEFNVKEYCETNHIRTFSTYNYYKYDFWMNEPQE